MKASFTWFAAALAVAVAAAPAQAYVVLQTGFDGLSGDNGDPFTGTYADGKIRVSYSSGQVYKGFSFGNSPPSLVVGPVFGGTKGAIEIMLIAGANMKLLSFDFTSQNGYGGYTVDYGRPGTDLIFAGGGDFNGEWQTISGFPGSSRYFLISFDAAGTSINFDNLVLGAVPEPASWALMIAGFGFVGGALRAQRKARVTA